MRPVEQIAQPPDGRAVRRERNVGLVLDVVVDIFTEGEFFPAIELVSKRSGVSVRSIYRYFEDPGDLYDAAIKRHRERTEPLAHLSAIGEGPLAQRVDDFVAMRLRLHAAIGATYRATVHGSPQHARLRDQLASTRTDLRHQFERQFQKELARRKRAEREAVLTAGDLLTQVDSIDLLLNYRHLSVSDAAEALRTGLMALLKGPR